jgi:adenosylmethionine-8-amino-7-oxononanoate aminotransferase
MELLRFTEEEKKQLAKSGADLILTHWANNEDLAKDPKIFTAGEGVYLYDINGKKYFDTFSSLVTNILGHGRPDINQAIMEQLKYLDFFPNYHDTYNVPIIRLAEKLAEILPGDLEVSFFVCSGSEANETAVKLARQYYWQTGRPHKYKVIARKYSYHGTTIGAASLTGFPDQWEYLEPLLPGRLFAPPARCCQCDLGLDVKSCDLACLKAMEDMIRWEHPETIAAIIMDPIPGSNIGYPLPPDGYLQGVRELCNKYDIMLIFDEVQVGFGKTGKWFACENWNVTPDIITLSKSITAGYAPLGVTVTTRKIADIFKQGPGTEFRSGSTYGGCPISCAIALATIEIMQKEKLVERTHETGKYLRAELEKLYKYKIVGDVRGIGMLWAVELMFDRKTRTRLDPGLKVGTFIRDWCWDNGMILRNNGDTLVMAPALTSTREEINMILGQLDKGISLAMKHFNL